MNSKGIFQLTKCYTNLKSLSLILEMKEHNFYRDILGGMEVKKILYDIFYGYCVDF